mgnify:FL=1
MAYYILYPKDQSKPVKVISKRPRRPHKNFGFAEGSFKTKQKVIYRLNMMNIPAKRRPKDFR